MNRNWDLIIIGGGVAGFSAAQAARSQDASISVLIISDEDRIPYKRTKLSKFLAEGFGRDQFCLQPASWYKQPGLDIEIQRRVTAIDPAAHLLDLEGGISLGWKKLILATGAEPVLPLSLSPWRYDERVRVLRTARQAETLRATVQECRSVLIVGMGVLGVELAEQLQQLGKQVIMVEREAQLMPHQLNHTTSQVLRRVLESRGIELRLNEQVLALRRMREGMSKEDPGQEQLLVELSADRLEVDLVLFCTGTRSRVRLAHQAGLGVSCGIRVNEFLQTSHEDIYAAGDAAEHPGERITHFWHAAEHQGAIAGANACGSSLRHHNPPFRLKCEVFDHYFFSMSRPARARLRDFDQVEYRGKDLYQCFYFEESHLQGALMINDKPGAKCYEQAVREGWSRPRVETQLLGRG